MHERLHALHRNFFLHREKENGESRRGRLMCLRRQGNSDAVLAVLVGRMSGELCMATSAKASYPCRLLRRRMATCVCRTWYETLLRVLLLRCVGGEAERKERAGLSLLKYNTAVSRRHV